MASDRRHASPSAQPTPTGPRPLTEGYQVRPSGGKIITNGYQPPAVEVKPTAPSTGSGVKPPPTPSK